MRKVSWRAATEAERMKYQAAHELGLLDKLLDGGWGGLTAEETGRVGALVARRLGRTADH